MAERAKLRTRTWWPDMAAGYLILRLGTAGGSAHPYLAAVCLWLLWAGLSAWLWRRVGTYRRSWRQALALLAGSCGWLLLLAMALLRSYWLGQTRGLAFPHREITLTSADGIRLQAYLSRSRRPDAVLVLHALGSHPRRRSVARLAGELAPDYDLLLVTLRGHPGSGGRVDAGVWQDADAGLRYLHSLGYRHVYGVGISLGSIALAQAVARDGAVDGVVLISSVARSETLDGARRLHSSLAGRALLGLNGVQVDYRSRLLEAPGVALRARRTPALVIHGLGDPLFPAQEAEIFASLGHHVTVRLLPGGHGSLLLRGREEQVAGLIKGWLNQR